MTPPVTEMADLYDACLAEVDRLAADLTPGQLTTRVPATPGWTVHQVLAHLAVRGFGEVTEYTTADERLTFSLPQELRRDMKAAAVPG